MQAKPDQASTIDQEGTLLAVITTEALAGVVLDRISEAEGRGSTSWGVTRCRRSG